MDTSCRRGSCRDPADQRVRGDPFQFAERLAQVRDFFLADQRIQRDVDASPAGMRQHNGVGRLLHGEVEVRPVHAHVELFHAEVDRVGPGIQHRRQGVPSPGGREQFHALPATANVFHVNHARPVSLYNRRSLRPRHRRNIRFRTPACTNASGASSAAVTVCASSR